MPDNTLTTTTPAGDTTTRPIPPSWATVAPLLERWQMALSPWRDGTWDVISAWPRRSPLPRHEARSVPFGALPKAILDVAARCEADLTREGEA